VIAGRAPGAHTGAPAAPGDLSRMTEPGPVEIPTIEIRALTKAYGSTPVLRSVSLDVRAGSITAILGASGSGKTTLLRLIAGFDHADSGRIDIAGQTVDDGHRTVPPQHRGVGYVPQDAALFPHLTVAGNVAFGLRRRERARLPQLLEMVGLTGFERRYPYQLSGGQQQRVALARALAIRPRVVLLDEPFSSLDAALRETVRSEVIEILAKTGTTTVLVTHDQDEALSLADRLAIVDAGEICAYGTPSDLYRRPPSPIIAAAIGTANVLAGQRHGAAVSCCLGTLPADGRDPGAVGDGPCQLLLRPEQLRLETAPDPARARAVVGHVSYHGHDTLISISVTTPAALHPDDPTGAPARSGLPANPVLSARIAGPTPLQPGQTVWVSVVGAPHVWA
jgi:iron(III) transport system ATP-binding protein